MGNRANLVRRLCNYCNIVRDEARAFADLAYRAEQIVWLDSTLGTMDGIIKDLPEEWAYEDAMGTVPADFDFGCARGILNQHHTQGFWNPPI